MILSMEIAGQVIERGTITNLDIPVGRLYDFTKVTIPIRVIAGKTTGPILFISAALHGDEINGVETIRRLLKRIKPDRLVGTLITIPIVNIFGFNTLSRYLPDRRDLNRCFPGSLEGSLGSRIAYVFLKEIVSQCTHGVDLHTGARHRYNLPQIRADLSNPEVLKLSQAFGASVILDSRIRDGSLREAVQEMNIPILLFEGGEALRFNEEAIRVAVRGLLNVMEELGMYKAAARRPRSSNTFVADSSRWVRATHGGIITSYKKSGEKIEEGQVIGIVSDPFGDHPVPVLAPVSGLVIGQTVLPLVNQGDALFNVASFDNIDDVMEVVEKTDFEKEVTRR